MISTETYLVLMLLASMAAGALGALVGVGGGILIVPILTMGFAVPVQYAMGASIVSVIGTSSGAASAHVKDKISNFKIGTFLNAATTTGAVIGSVLSIYLVGIGLSSVIYLIFGAVLMYCAYDLYRKVRKEHRIGSGDFNVKPNRISEALGLKGEYYDPALRQKLSYEAGNAFGGLGIMGVAGLLSGLLGIGSGALNVLSMDEAMRLPFKVSTATSNFIIGVSAAASAGIFLLKGWVNLLIVGPVAIGVTIGSVAGAKALTHSKPLSIRIVFTLILVISSVEMLQKGIALI